LKKTKDNKQLILTVDQKLYDDILVRAKTKNITALAEIRNLLTAGIKAESRNDDISYIVRKIDNYDDRLWKILNSIQLTFDLTVQEFVNMGYRENRNPNFDRVYQDFWENRRRKNNKMNDWWNSDIICVNFTIVNKKRIHEKKIML